MEEVNDLRSSIGITSLITNISPLFHSCFPSPVALFDDLAISNDGFI